MNPGTFNPDADSDRIKSRITDERAHAMWHADRFQYPPDICREKNRQSALNEFRGRCGTAIERQPGISYTNGQGGLQA